MYTRGYNHSIVCTSIYKVKRVVKIIYKIVTRVDVFLQLAKAYPVKYQSTEVSKKRRDYKIEAKQAMTSKM